MDDSLHSEVDESQDPHHVKFLNDSPLTSSSRTHQQFETIHAPLIRVQPFISSPSSSSTQPVLTPTQAAGVVIHIIQFIIVNLQLTSGSWAEILSTRQQIEKDAERSSKPMPIKRKKFMKMMHGLETIFESIMRAFTVSTSRTDLTSDHPPHCVEEILIMFGTSAQTAAMAYRIHIACSYISNTSADSPSHLQSILRTITRELIQHSAELFPLQQNPAMRSSNMKMSVNIRLNRRIETEELESVDCMELSDTSSSTDSNADHISGHQDSALSSFFQFAHLTFKPNFFPRLTEEYRRPIESIAASPTEPNQSETDRDSTMMEPQPYQPRARTHRRHRTFKPKHCMPYTIAIGEKSQYHSFNITSRSHTLTPTTSVHDWYQCGSSIKFVRDLVIL